MSYYEVEPGYWEQDREYDETPRRRRYSCNGYSSYSGPCGGYDCESCYPGGEGEPEELEVSSRRIVTVRKARYVGTPREVRPGDRAWVYRGFTYTRGGPRSYFSVWTLLTKGPAWPAEDLSADIGF